MLDNTPTERWISNTRLGIILTLIAVITSCLSECTFWNRAAVHYSNSARDLLVGSCFSGEGDADTLLYWSILPQSVLFGCVESFTVGRTLQHPLLDELPVSQ